MAQTSQTLYFPSQVAADKYILTKEIEELGANPVTSSTAAFVAERLASLQTRLDALDAPIYRLTDGLLADIFTLALPHLAFHNDNTPDLVCFSLTISQVTSRFRRVVLTTPRLWSNIPVDMRTTSLSKVKTRVDALSKRAASLPLNLQVTFPRNANYKQRALDDLARTLIGVAPRVESLSMSNEWYKLQSCRWKGSDNDLWLDLFHACPLIHVHLEGYFPFRGFRSLRELCDLLNEKPTLEHLTLTDYVFEIASNGAGLQALWLRSLDYDDEDTLHPLLTRVHLPHLTHLTFRYAYVDIHNTDLLFPLAPEICSITLVEPFLGWNIGGSFISSFISSVPLLTELHITIDELNYSYARAGRSVSVSRRIGSHGTLTKPIVLKSLVLETSLSVHGSCRYTTNQFCFFLMEILEGPPCDEEEPHWHPGFVIDTLDIRKGPRIPNRMRTWLEGRVETLKCDFEVVAEEGHQAHILGVGGHTGGVAGRGDPLSWTCKSWLKKMDLVWNNMKREEQESLEGDPLMIG